MIKAVIFDLDGVIVSTDELHYQAWKMITNQENISFNHEINHKLRGVSRMDSLDIILKNSTKKYTDEEKLDLAEKKNMYYVESLKKLTRNDVLPGILEVIKELSSRGIKLAIGSSSRNAKTILTYLKLKDLFDAIADGNDCHLSKPAPDIFLKAAEKLKISPDSCVVIEDAEAGIEAAKKAGMVAVALFDARKSSLADYRLDNILDLLDIL